MQSCLLAISWPNCSTVACDFPVADDLFPVQNLKAGLCCNVHHASDEQMFQRNHLYTLYTEKKKHIRDNFYKVAILRTALLLTVEQVTVTTCKGGLGSRGREEALE